MVGAQAARLADLQRQCAQAPPETVLAVARLEELPQGIPVVVDGLALGALPEAAEKIAQRAPLVALVHHPLALEAGLLPADSRKLFESERKALAAARSVIVTSRATGKRLNADYDVPPERITVAPPGTDRGAPAKGSLDGTLRLLSVGAVVPRKGFDALIAALASIAGLPWRLTIAGDLTRDPATAAKLEADIARHGLAGRVDLLGADGAFLQRPHDPRAQLAPVEGNATAIAFDDARHHQFGGLERGEPFAAGQTLTPPAHRLALGDESPRRLTRAAARLGIGPRGRIAGTAGRNRRAGLGRRLPSELPSRLRLGLGTVSSPW